MSAANAAELDARFAAGDARALAQAITLVERQDPRVGELIDRLSPAVRRQPPSVGFTGAPGAGKSTLVSAMVRSARARGARVGVLAVDPSSPYSGGALLGDRVRMREHALDRGVYVRSMSNRGHSGGLAPATAEAIWLLGAFGFDEILVETVGAGQSELELRFVVDTTVVVLTPGTGDSIQVQKAGIMEIADVFAVNKADVFGAGRLVRDVRTMLNLGSARDWRPPIVPTVATGHDGSPEAMWEAIAQHRRHLAETEAGREQARSRRAAAAAAAVAEHARRWASEWLRHDEPAASAERLPSRIAERLLTEHAHLSYPARGAGGNATKEDATWHSR